MGVLGEKRGECVGQVGREGDASVWQCWRWGRMTNIPRGARVCLRHAYRQTCFEPSELLPGPSRPGALSWYKSMPAGSINYAPLAAGVRC